MPIQVKCACGRTINVLDELAGRQAHCVYCGATVPVPGTPVASSAPAVPASFPLLPPILDHLNIARRMYGTTPRVMNPALHKVIDFAMGQIHDALGEPDFQDKGLDEVTDAVRNNPLTAGFVVRSAASLQKAGGGRAPAAVVFSTDSMLAFDTAYLRRVGEKVMEVGHTRRNPGIAPVQGPFDDAKWDGCMELPPGVDAVSKTWLASMVVDPSSLPEGRLGSPFIAGIACPRLRRFRRCWVLSV